jgi:hypothetical protein
MLVYMATNPDAIIRYHASDMMLIPQVRPAHKYPNPPGR